jgi:hypothetical protein
MCMYWILVLLSLEVVVTMEVHQQLKLEITPTTL